MSFGKKNTNPDDKIIGYKFRIYPTKEQAEKISYNIDVVKAVYNEALYLQNKSYEDSLINAIKERNLELKYYTDKNGKRQISTKCLGFYKKELIEDLCKEHNLVLKDKNNKVLDIAEHLSDYQKLLTKNNLYPVKTERVAYSYFTNNENEEKRNRFKSADSLAVNCGLRNLSKAYDNYFEGRSQKPCSKKRGYKNFETNMPDLDNVSGAYETCLSKLLVKEELCLKDMDKKYGYVKLPKIGWVKIRLHRDFPENFEWSSNYIIVSKTPSQKYYISFKINVRNCKNYNKKSEHLDINKSVGIDLGAGKHQFITSDNEYYGNLLEYERCEEHLQKLNERLSRMKTGSKNWEKQKTKIAKLHEKIAEKRKKHVEYIINDLFKKYDYIVMEDLDVKSMTAKPIMIDDISLRKQGLPVPEISDYDKKHLIYYYRSDLEDKSNNLDNLFREKREIRKKVLDSNFGYALEYAKKRADKTDKKLIKVDRYFKSTQICSNCGCENDEIRGFENLDKRIFKCSHCGFEDDRDHNSSVNILREGIKM